MDEFAMTFRDTRRLGRMTKKFSTQEWQSFKRDAEAADMSVSEAFDWVLATASAAGVTKRVFRAFAVVARAEKKLAVMRDAARHVSRVNWFAQNYIEGKSGRGTTIKAFRALLDIAREKRGLAREVGAAEEWQVAYARTTGALREVLAQQELVPEKPPRKSRGRSTGLPVDSEPVPDDAFLPDSDPDFLVPVPGDDPPDPDPGPLPGPGGDL